MLFCCVLNFSADLAHDYLAAIMKERRWLQHELCLLYTYDAADERSSVDLGGSSLIKKKKTENFWRKTNHNRNRQCYYN